MRGVIRKRPGTKWLFLDSFPALFYNRNKVNQQRKNSGINERNAFFALFLILFVTPAPKVSGQDTFIRLKVVAEQANIRLEPDISSIIIRQVPQGTILNATEKMEEWFAVQLMPKQGAAVSGYVHESLVIVVEPLPEKKTPARKPTIIPVKPKSEQQPSPFKFDLSITGGGNYVRTGDMNPGIEGLADLYEDILGVQGKGEIDPVHLGYVFGIEFSSPVSESLSWGIGAEHFQGKNESRVDYVRGETSSVLLMRPNLRATPLTLFLSFQPAPNLYVKGGISYYFARCSYSYLFQIDDLTQQWVGKANAQGLGLSGGLGLIKSLSPSLSFFTEITGRLAKIKGFKGIEDFQDSSGEILTEKGTLYFIQTQILEDRTHSVLFIRETRPNEAGVIGARKAQIDFSGISIKLGLRIHF